LSTLDLNKDKGESDPVLLSLLQNKGNDYEKIVFNGLKNSRLIGAIVAKKHENVEMMQALFSSNDGKVAMPVFTSLDELTKWNKEARPTPLISNDFAQQTIDQELDALILDIASDHRFVIQGYMLRCLAKNQDWSYPHQDSEVRKTIEKICLKIKKVNKVEITKGVDCDLHVNIYGPPDLADEVIGLGKEIAEQEIIRERAPLGADLFLTPLL
jgi:SseB protein N-terminal domain